MRARSAAQLLEDGSDWRRVGGPHRRPGGGGGARVVVVVVVCSSLVPCVVPSSSSSVLCRVCRSSLSLCSALLLLSFYGLLQASTTSRAANRPKRVRREYVLTHEQHTEDEATNERQGGPLVIRIAAVEYATPPFLPHPIRLQSLTARTTFSLLVCSISRGSSVALRGRSPDQPEQTKMDIIKDLSMTSADTRALVSAVPLPTGEL
jgi:hypothetical protein